MHVGAATSRMTAIVGPPSATEMGMSAVRPARPRSARNIIRLRSLRSAIAPATIPRKRSGSVWSAPTMPIAKADPVTQRRDPLAGQQDPEVSVLCEGDIDRLGERLGGRL